MDDLHSDTPNMELSSPPQVFSGLILTHNILEAECIRLSLDHSSPPFPIFMNIIRLPGPLVCHPLWAEIITFFALPSQIGGWGGNMVHGS